MPVLGSVSGAVPVLLLISATRLCDASKLISVPLGKKKISTSASDDVAARASNML